MGRGGLFFNFELTSGKLEITQLSIVKCYGIDDSPRESKGNETYNLDTDSVEPTGRCYNIPSLVACSSPTRRRYVRRETLLWTRRVYVPEYMVCGFPQPLSSLDYDQDQ